MFTGIIEELGTVESPGECMAVMAPKVAADSGPGASVAVNGVCLTVTDRDGGRLAFDLSPETLRRSNLGGLSAGDRVNLERPLTLLARLGGHLVQGHVDGVGKVARTRSVETGLEMEIEAPESLGSYIVEKGSITVDGVSLTVASVALPTFGVALIPYTLEATNLGRKEPGDPVNLEADVVAKYVEGILRRTR